MKDPFPAAQIEVLTDGKAILSYYEKDANGRSIRMIQIGRLENETFIAEHVPEPEFVRFYSPQKKNPEP